MDITLYAILKNKITEIRQKLLKVVEDTADMNSRIVQNTNNIEKKLDKNQGASNSGKIAGINESGDIVPMFPQGVTYNENTQCLEYGADEKLNLNAGIQLDDTLSKVGYAADAASVGELKSDIANLSKQNCVSILSGITEAERDILNNLRYIRAIGIDLDGWRVSCVTNTPQYPHTVILRHETDSISVNVEAETYPTVIKTNNYTIYFGYNWSKHTTDLNTTYDRSHIEINVKGSEIPDIDFDIAAIKEEIIGVNEKYEHRCENIEESVVNIQNAINEYDTKEVVDGLYVRTNSYISDVGDRVYYSPDSWANSYAVHSYPVESNKRYRLLSDSYRIAAAYACVIFTTTNLAEQSGTFITENVEVIIDKSLSTTERKINVDYIPKIDGYIIIAVSPNTNIPIVVYNTEMVSKIDKLTNQLIGKVIYTLGDSITYLNGSWAHQLASKTGAKVFNIGRGGSKWADRGSNQIDYNESSAIWNNPFVFNTSDDGMTESYPANKDLSSNVPPCDNTGYTTISNEIRFMKRLTSEYNRPMPDYIVIACGINDVTQSMPEYSDELFNGIVDHSLSLNSMTNQQKSTIYGGLRWCIETLMTEYPDAQIILATPIQSAYEYLRPYIHRVNDWIKKFHEYYATRLINAYAESGISAVFEKGWGITSYTSTGTNGRYLYDGLHPNDDGKRVQGNYMAKMIVNTISDK